MTDEAIAVESAEPAILYTAYLSAAEDVLEHVRAADTLGLGVRVESYSVSTGDGTEPEWRFDLLMDLPVREHRED